MTAHPRIEGNPQILVGKPVIRGTRLAVEFIVRLLVDSWSYADIRLNYPGVIDEDIKACLKYAAERG